MLMDHQQHVSQLFTAPRKTATRLTKTKLGDSAIVSLHYTSKFIGKIRNLGENGYCRDFCPKDFPNFQAFTSRNNKGIQKLLSKVPETSIYLYMMFQLDDSKSLRFNKACVARLDQRGTVAMALRFAPIRHGSCKWAWIQDQKPDPKNKTKQKITQLPAFGFLFMVFLGSCIFNIGDLFIVGKSGQTKTWTLYDQTPSSVV